MKYYTVEDVMGITGAGQTKSYEIIRELNKKFKKMYPNAVYIQGKVLKTFFDECMGIKKAHWNSLSIDRALRYGVTVTV